MATSKNKHDRLIWIDLEMTGLNYDVDVILEIATIVTDGNLNIIATGPNLIIHRSDEILQKMNTICTEIHMTSGLYQQIQQSTLTIEQAQEQTLAFLEQHCTKGASPLCGNTVWFDKLFLKKEMPFIYDFLHYRIVDVTSLKVTLNLWSKHAVFFKKANAHRALADIHESIAELQFYKNNFIKLPES